ncbi:MAG: hypothetical protein IKK14_01890 [Oscillospiraceae bacterium]|nr:hypothetical protein [Oscillospiraceae bacterium]
MKKILAFILALTMLLSFASCSESETKEPETEEIVPARGTVENGIYKNSAFGVGFEAGENWYFLTDEEIASAMGVAAETMYGEDAEITGDHVYDLYCVDNATSATVSINYENLGTIGTMTDANYYLETVMTQLISSGAGSGVVDAIISNITIDEQEVPCLSIVLEYGGQKIYQKVIVKQVGNWMATATLASLSEEELSGLVEKINLE